MAAPLSAPLDTTYEPFALEPEYLELNREFVRSLDLGTPSTVVDLACGTATLSTLLLDEVGATGRARRVRMIGIDLLRVSLEIGMRFLADHVQRGTGAVCLIEGRADELPIDDASVDVALIGNAIHCFEDKDGLLSEVRRVVRPGGVFAFNSSFYAGTFPAGTETFYTEWLKAALAALRDRDVARVRGRGHVAFSRPWLSAAEYSALLERSGFSVRTVNERTLAMTQRNFETVGAFDGLARVLLSGYPVAEAADALVRGVGIAMSQLGLSVVPRRWLEVAAVRR